MAVVMGADGKPVAVPSSVPDPYADIEIVQEVYGDKLINPGEKRGAFFSLDPGGAFGHRQKAIEAAAKKFDAGSKKFDIGESAWKHGVTQQDVANWYMTQSHKARRNDESVEYGRKFFPKGQRPNAATSQDELEVKVKDIKDRKTAETLIRELDKGGEKLAAAEKEKGRKLTLTELETLKTDVSNSTPQAQRTAEGEQASIDLTNQQIQASKATVAQGLKRLGIEQGQLNLNSRIAQNTAVYNARNADIATINANNQRIQLENAEKNAQADRTLRKDLALLTREDNAEDRRYERERDERKDRQLMIMQLMQGLANLGKSAAI